MKHESYELAEFKAVTDGPRRGLFAALVSVFGNVDRKGDRMMRGAFAKSIDRWLKSEHPIPVVWSHEWQDPNAYIGAVDPRDVRETKDGLVVAGKLDIEDNPKASKIYDLLASGRLKQWSFGYEVKDETLGKDGARNLNEVDLFEVGPTLVGANPDVRTLAVKAALLAPEELEDTEPVPEPEPVPASALERVVTKTLTEFDGDIDRLIESKIGRAISARTEARIRAALNELGGILSSLDEDTESEPKQVSIPEASSFGENEALRVGLSEAGLFLAQRR